MLLQEAVLLKQLVFFPHICVLLIIYIQNVLLQFLMSNLFIWLTSWHLPAFFFVGL